jgi:hypothetical protein
VNCPVEDVLRQALDVAETRVEAEPFRVPRC